MVGNSTPLHDRGSKSTPFISYKKLFEKHCSFYMSIGMSYKEYWQGDCALTKYYYDAYLQKVEREQRISNQNAWIQGFYIYEAILDASPILQAFAKKGTKPLKYRDKPIPFTKDEQKENEEQERNARLDRLKTLLSNSVKGVNKNA